MKDRKGHDYSELLAIQAAHLSNWAIRLKPAIHADVSAYICSQNEEAPTAEGTHRVFRGADIAQIIYDWPLLKDCYPKPGSEVV